ncbi:MAG: AgmX/PglI C-terminal domain-containing protein [Leptospiraceae bacterium]|nr:AgmX/PglI C-terminal domain-containing protein [Leptospiraceae bacterium]
MDKKNNIIIVLTALLVAMGGLFVYNMKKQQEIQQQLLRNMEYNAANVGGDNKGKPKDPYKEIAVNNALRKKARDIQECYNGFLKTNPPKTDGFVEIDWNILEDGRVKKAELVNSDLMNDSLNQCILKIIGAIEFPPPPTGQQTYMTYKYNFKMDPELKDKK